MKARAEQLHEIEGGNLSFQVFRVAGANATGVGFEPVGAIAASESQAGSLILDFAPNDVGPGLLGQRTGDIELQTHQPVGARVRQKRQENAARLVVVARGEEADSVLRAGRKHRMREVDFAVVENDYGNVLERDKGCLFLLYGQ